MIHFTSLELTEQLPNSIINNSFAINGIGADTRTLQPGNLFVAIKGQRVDGHDLLLEAKNKGAHAALVNREISDAPLPLVIVSDTVLALGELATKWRAQFDLHLIGLTGSNGKTTVKEMIAAIFAKAVAGTTQNYLASVGNLNTEIGMPLNLLELFDKHRYAVIEMAMRGFDQIAYLSKIAQPNVALITNAFPSHLEKVGDTLEGVAQAKGEIFEGLAKEGVAILNKDDQFFNYWRKLLKFEQTVLSFALESNADFMAQSLQVKNNQQVFELISPIGSLIIRLPLLGKHNIANALAAAAACFAVGIDLNTIKVGLESMQAVNQRQVFKAGINNSVIIDDTYNANPASLKAGIDTLAQFSSKKVLVLADMKELGEKAEFYHTHAGEYARNTNINYLFTYGELAKHAAESFGNEARHFVDKQQLITYLKSFLQDNMHVLIKGSRSMKMEEVVGELVMSDR